MTKEGIKAVRFCMGYNTNLRVKLVQSAIPGARPYRESVADFLYQNFFGIYGVAALERLGINTIDPVALGFERYEFLIDFLSAEAWDVCTGVPRDNFPPCRVC